jgi:DNA-binding CsgD family transcriptional regulator
MFIAQSTIETHAKHIYRKLGIHSREELLALFLKE